MISYSQESLVKNIAREVGFDAVGITGIKPGLESDRTFDQWIDGGRHGEMRYLSGGSDKRHDPGLLLEGAKSIICTALNYYDAAHSDGDQERAGAFAMYARGRDYHAVFSEMLSDMSDRLLAAFPRMTSVACVDTQPISERDIAIRSGVAWLGKNTCVISREFGSWIVLGELITSLDLSPDAPAAQSLCGSCTRCIDACPTGALDEPYVLDARRCISYLTIEKRGEIPAEQHAGIGGHVFGCDICQDVCPYNRVAKPSTVFSGESNSLVAMSLDELIGISDSDYRELTRDSAINRCKAGGLRRNARIARVNLGRERLRLESS